MGLSISVMAHLSLQMDCAIVLLEEEKKNTYTYSSQLPAHYAVQKRAERIWFLNRALSNDLALLRLNCYELFASPMK